MESEWCVSIYIFLSMCCLNIIQLWIIKYIKYCSVIYIYETGNLGLSFDLVKIMCNLQVSDTNL